MVRIDYKPEITLEQIAAFDPGRPETHTRSAFINAVCRSFAKNGILNGREIGRSIGLTDREFLGAFKALTGISYSEARKKLVTLKAKEMIRKHPQWSTLRIANELGFRNRGSLWSFIPKDIYRQIHPESKTQFLRRMAAEFERKSKLD